LTPSCAWIDWMRYGYVFTTNALLFFRMNVHGEKGEPWTELLLWSHPEKYTSMEAFEVRMLCR